jgi:integrase
LPTGLVLGGHSNDLRHLAASLMLVQDVNPKVMQEILGHSQLSMTMDLYAHLIGTAKHDVAARLDALFAEDSGA